MSKEWQGLTAEEIATIPNDEFRLQTVERILKDRNTHPVKEQGNPVAWRSKDRDGYWCIYQSPVKGAEPLYTGFKELTDEEIAEVWKNMPPDNDSGLAFARAILKRAQEK